MLAKAWKSLAWLGILASVLVLAACGPDAPETESEHEPTELNSVSLDAGEKLQVVATTNIVGDVVANVGGGQIDLTVLMGIGVDPHTYVPNPSDTAAIHDAHVVFANGAGLEANLEDIFDNAGGDAVHIHVSEGIDFRPPPGEEEHEHEHEAEAEGSHDHGEAEGSHDHGEAEGSHGHGDVDPHVWFSVPNVIHWTERIEETLSALDPNNAATYQANAEAYIARLEELDAWIEEQVAAIPEENRKLVTNHPVFGYLAERYGLEQVGAVYPVNPAAEPSAQDIAALQDTIREFGVPAVFTESTVNPRLARQVAQDTGIKLVPLYTGSLGEPGSGAETYIEMMRYDLEAIVEALQ